MGIVTNLMDLAQVCRIVFSPMPSTKNLVMRILPDIVIKANEMQNRSLPNRRVLDWLDITLQS